MEPDVLIDSDSTSYVSAPVDMSKYSWIVLNTRGTDGRTLGTTLIDSNTFVDCGTISHQAAFGKEPTSYCAIAYYSGGRVYAKSSSTFDRVTVMAI